MLLSSLAACCLRTGYASVCHQLVLYMLSFLPALSWCLMAAAPSPDAASLCAVLTAPALQHAHADTTGKRTVANFPLPACISFRWGHGQLACCM